MGSFASEIQDYEEWDERRTRDWGRETEERGRKS